MKTIEIEKNFIYKSDASTLTVTECSLINFIAENEVEATNYDQTDFEIGVMQKENNRTKKELYGTTTDEIYKITLKRLQTWNTGVSGNPNQLGNKILFVTVSQGERRYEMLFNGFEVKKRGRFTAQFGLTTPVEVAK